MKEISVSQMQQIKGAGPVACGAMIFVTLVGVASGMGALSIGFFVGSLYSSTSPC